MKKIAALGLAAAVALTATVASTGADAKPFWPHNPWPMYHHNYHPHPGFYLSTPFFFGFSFGPQYPRFYPGNLHVQWCASRYRTYNPATNTFFIKKGVPAVCVSPYWHH